MSAAPYEEIEHTADWALLVRGATMDSLFEHAAQGMLALLEPIYLDSAARRKTLELSAIDPETLLVSWLEELLFLLQTENVGFHDFDVHVDGNSLQAAFKAIPLVSIKKDIKAVTYNELEVVNVDGSFQTTIVFDV